MPKVRQTDQKGDSENSGYSGYVYLGIDPGQSGGMAVLWPDGGVDTISMPETESEIWDWIDGIRMWSHKLRTVIEQQTPRPTGYFDRSSGQWKSTILRSTCILYGQYCLIRGMLISSGIPFEECPPVRWQKALGIPQKRKKEGKRKGETDSEWKNRLKVRAQQLFPQIKVTLSTSDALLIAEFCRRVNRGEIEE